MPDAPGPPTEPGLILIQRLHRLVRHGYRPWLGYDVASRQDHDIHLRAKRSVATLRPDATLVFSPPLPAARITTIPGDDHQTFDALFPPNRPNKRNLLRRLYEIGL